MSADATPCTGQFLSEKAGERVNCTLIQKHTVKHSGKDTQFAKLPPDQRFRFHCYRDDKGRFTCVPFISDDFSHLATNAKAAHVTAVLPAVSTWSGCCRL